MAEALTHIPQSNHPNLLVGFNKADDAGVYKINDQQALVQTVDFFPPIVDDPYYFGQIAAANALSDVYAMGGVPLTALSIVGFPSSMEGWILAEILKGGSDKVTEADAVIVGGHSIKDKELKYGLSITGLVHPEKVITNSGAKIGNKLYLTKKLGTGLITTGIKNNVVSEDLIDIVIKQMATLNKQPAELMVKHGVTACTDITGYGLLGHAAEMAEGSEVTLRINSVTLPLLPEVLALAEQKMIPGGALANREFLEGKWEKTGELDPNLEAVLFDPQTSGGLLMAIPAENAARFEREAKALQLEIALIGEVLPQGDRLLIIS